MTELFVWQYGSGSVPLIVLHGGPAASGDVTPLARALGERWYVIEPHQRGSGDTPLTVSAHVQDLHEVIQARCGAVAPVVIGHSWGAMLGLAHAAAHPDAVRALVLIGCGTFSLRTRAEFHSRLNARLSPSQRESLVRLRQGEMDEDERLATIGLLLRQAMSHDAEEAPSGAARPGTPVTVDARAHRQTWDDMLRLQARGVYPSAFQAIHVPVLMLHGDRDPHPGPLIADELRPHLPQIEYRELPSCGHVPWLERQARQLFWETLEAWLRDRAGESALRPAGR